MTRVFRVIDLQQQCVTCMLNGVLQRLRLQTRFLGVTQDRLGVQFFLSQRFAGVYQFRAGFVARFSPCVFDCGLTRVRLFSKRPYDRGYASRRCRNGGLTPAFRLVSASGCVWHDGRITLLASPLSSFERIASFILHLGALASDLKQLSRLTKSPARFAANFHGNRYSFCGQYQVVRAQLFQNRMQSKSNIDYCNYLR